MDTRLFVRAGAIALAAVAITLAVIQMREPAASPPQIVADEPAAEPTDPLRAELRRCQAIGAEAAGDRGCIRAWAENRRRFLTPGAGADVYLDDADAAGEPVPSEDPLLKLAAPADQAGE